MLDNLKTDKTIEEERDVLGGKYILESDVYPMIIDMAYVDKSQGGATSINLLFKGKNGENLRSTQWVTSGKAKGGNNYYIDKNSNKQYLPGFNIANAIALLAIGKELSELTTEKKTINIYDYTKGKEVPTEKDVIMDLLGAEITIGVVKQIVDKTAKNNAGVYTPTGETREENEVKKVFRFKDGFTISEIRAEATESVFMNKWLEKNKGITINKSIHATDSVVTGGASANTNTNTNNNNNNNNSEESTKSLFGSDS